MTKKEPLEARIEELEKMIKDIRSGAIKGDIKYIRKMINKYKEKIKKLDNEIK